eukprot:symbB.v1.2.001883.t1/scaffold79.1/size344139/14
MFPAKPISFTKCCWPLWRTKDLLRGEGARPWSILGLKSNHTRPFWRSWKSRGALSSSSSSSADLDLDVLEATLPALTLSRVALCGEPTEMLHPPVDQAGGYPS